jgi:pimeloyl-ACP methyl ester carboxylesterase
MQKIITFTLAMSIGLYINILSYIYPEKARQLAYKFFSEPRTGRLIKEQLPKILKEAVPEIITHHDFVFQTYTWTGNGHTVLLVHGWEINASRWEELISYLNKNEYTIVALDAPAHGLSSGQEFSIPRYAQFIDIVVKKIQPQYMIGHSLGGATALYYQSHYPNNIIEKMAVLGAPCDLNTLLYNYSKILSLNSTAFKLLKKHFHQSFDINTDEFSGSNFAKKIKVKGLLAHDEKDEVVSFKEGKKIAESWPHAEFVVTQGLGHSMHDALLYKKICTFLLEA